MKFDLSKTIEILDRTPTVLKSLLSNLNNDWVIQNEGPETFSPYDVVGHLIHGERTDWVVRAKIILTAGLEKPFTAYDRFAQFKESKGKTIQQLLDEFELVRKENIGWLQSIQLTEDDLDRKGMHPVLGEVSLRNLLSTWVVHDLTHLAQITRVMAKQYKEEMGPWVEYFRLMNY